ncbi:MAG: hypothetical protein KDK54_23075, partial [Leptospiraceae bacterium]|nr:hypothetical protein [Leptospiraceae bacterium]
IYASCFETNLLFPVFCTSPDREIQDRIQSHFHEVCVFTKESAIKWPKPIIGKTQLFMKTGIFRKKRIGDY